MKDYFKAFPRLKRWIDEQQKFIADNGYIYSHFGRKRRLANVFSTDKAVKNHAIRSGFNFLIQSVSSDANLLGAIDMWRHIKATGMKARMFALVHDSILAEVPEHEVDEYVKKLKGFIQTDRGVSIPGAAIGCDFEVGDDYSFGKWEKQYAMA